MRSDSNKKSFEFFNDVEESTTKWDCDIRSVMADQFSIYDTFSGNPLARKYRQPLDRAPRTLASLFLEDLAYFASFVPEVEALAGDVEIIQYDGATPNASILITGDKGSRSTIGVSTAFMKFTTLFMSKFCTQTKQHPEERLHPTFRDEIHTDKWKDDNLYVSVLKDAVEYSQVDYELELQRYKYLHEPYDLCELVIGIRRFALLHELCHLHLHRTGSKVLADDGVHEEFVADRLAHEWLLRPFIGRSELSETEKYELLMAVQSPLSYFLVLAMPFAMHHWPTDKHLVLAERTKDHYVPHPLRREMNLVGGLFDSPVFRTDPDLVDNVTGYLWADVWAYEPNVLLTFHRGQTNRMRLCMENEWLASALDLVEQSAADSYYIYSELDRRVAVQHAIASQWIFQSFYDRIAARDDVPAVERKYAPSMMKQDFLRRMGVTRQNLYNESVMEAEIHEFGMPSTSLKVASQIVELTTGKEEGAP